MCERFALIAQDPHHPRALLLTLSLTRTPKGSSAGCRATLFDGDAERPWHAQEAWPLDRALIDPARAGLGIGECHLDPAGSTGLIQSSPAALSWQLQIDAPGTPVPLLPVRCYRRGWLSHKTALVQPRGTIRHGQAELWHGGGRYVGRTRLDLTGWHVAQLHTFGSSPPRPDGTGCALHVHVPAHAGPGCDLVLLGTALGGLLRAEPQLGAVHADGGPHVLRAWRRQSSASLPQLRDAGLQVQLRGDAGVLTAEVRLPAAAPIVAGMMHHGELAEAAGVHVTGSWQPHGGAAQPIETARAIATWMH